MSKRLQVLLPDAEMEGIRRAARGRRVSVGRWVREALREALARTPGKSPEEKIRAIRAASGYSFPTGDIQQVLAEIERGFVR